jgi:large subunit ribosomal protein L30
MAFLRITWTRSRIGHCAAHREVIRSLGLKRLNHTVVHKDNPSIRGMVRKVPYMLRVQEVEEPGPGDGGRSSRRSRPREGDGEKGAEAGK